MNWLKTVLLVLVATVAFGFQEPDESEGQPATCDNYKTTVHKCACGRAKMCGRDGHGSGDPDFYHEGPNKCQTACRKQACMCLGPCTSRK